MSVRGSRLVAVVSARNDQTAPFEIFAYVFIIAMQRRDTAWHNGPLPLRDSLIYRIWIPLS